METRINEREVMNKLSNDNIPYVGMGATFGYGSDCYPATVIEVSKSGKQVVIQYDKYKRIDKGGPYTENQEYEYTQNPEGPKMVVKFRKSKRYPDGKWKTQSGAKITLGFRRAYQDPHF